MDLFGPLPPEENREKWILLVEDTVARWVESRATLQRAPKYLLRDTLCVLDCHGVLSPITVFNLY